MKEEFELREKRLNLVYKILYVLAALWAAIFISYIQNPGNTAPVYCCFLAILTTSISNILSFIFGELKCLRISLDTDPKTKNIADMRFIGIWETFSYSLSVSIVVLWINLTFPSVVTKLSLLVFMTVSALADGVINNIDFANSKVKLNIHSLLLPVICYSFFALVQVLS